jgi:hypothetical protein
MADFVFNIAKGAAAEKVRDGATVIGIMLLKAAEADATFKDRDDLAAILANGGTEADFTNYTRKTGITGTITVDDVNDRVDVDIPDQTWTSAGGASNNTLSDAVVYYQEAAADASRVPLTNHDFALTTDGSDVTLVVNASGFFRAS